MKKTVAGALVLCMLLSLITGLLAGVLPAAAEPKAGITTDKTVYAPDEPIQVTATGEGRDWVGLYRAEDTYDPNAGGQMSIYWYYVAIEGNASGDTKNIYDAEYNNFAGRPEFASGLPAGDYKVVLMANDGYDVLAEAAITIRDQNGTNTPAAPASAEYTSNQAGTGRADGTVTIGHDGEAPEAYILRWGNSNGAVAGYTDIARISCTGAETVFAMTPHTLIPVGADRILVYAVNGQTLSEKAAIANLPAGAGKYDLGTLQYELQVMSDIHINPDDSHIHNRHFKAALADIKMQSPQSIGIFINGDVADHGQISEYKAFNRLIEAAGAGLPPVYAAIGNHDYAAGGSDAEKLAAFLKGTNNDGETVYFERVVSGVRCIFLGSEQTGTAATLSRTQLDWLDETLDRDRDASSPVFLFLHQGIMDTVAGTMEYQGWHGVNQESALKRILADHPEVVLFSGHSHWKLESAYSVKPADDTLPTILNTSSCAYLWDDACMTTNQGIVGSQGYYIYVYEDKMVFRGRNFAEGTWISSAQFVVDKPEVATQPETNVPETSAPNTVNDETTAPLQTDPGTGSPSAPTDSRPHDTDAGLDQDPGCASALPLLPLFLLPATGYALRRRRRD